jgi:hypothetical protein
LHTCTIAFLVAASPVWLAYGVREQTLERARLLSFPRHHPARAFCFADPSAPDHAGTRTSCCSSSLAA